jgi:hypothetical protein
MKMTGCEFGGGLSNKTDMWAVIKKTKIFTFMPQTTCGPKICISRNIKVALLSRTSVSRQILTKKNVSLYMSEMEKDAL